MNYCFELMLSPLIKSNTIPKVHFMKAEMVWMEFMTMQDVEYTIGSVHKFVAKFREMSLAIVFFHSHMFQT